jgi:hypothetical protein
MMKFSFHSFHTIVLLLCELVMALRLLPKLDIAAVLTISRKGGQGRCHRRQVHKKQTKQRAMAAQCSWE